MPHRPSVVVSWLAAAVVVVAAGAAGGLSPDPVKPAPAAAPTTSPSPSTDPTPTAAPRPPLETAQLASVMLTWPCGTERECPHGSGTVVDSSGLILTNAHDAPPASPGLAAQYEELAEDVTDPPYLIVSVPPTAEADAVPLYRASVVAVDGYADLAVVRVDATADGEPRPAPPSMTNIALGALGETKKDDEIRVIGYPATGDSLSPTVQRGTIASKPRDPEGRVEGAWELNTAAPIHGGNSGGSVVDAQGRLVAIPTYSRGFTEQVFRARAVELARPMIEAAQARKAYESPHLVPLTGQEQLVDVAWSDEEFGEECVDPADVTATGWSGSLHVQVRLSGLGDGEDFRLVVTRPDGTVGTSRQGAWSDQPCLHLWMAPFFEGEPLDPGTYTVTALAGPAWDEVGQAATEVVESAGD